MKNRSGSFMIASKGVVLRRGHEAINQFSVFKFPMRNWQSAFNKWREINTRLWKVIRGDQQNRVVMKIFSPLPVNRRRKFLEIEKGKMKNFEGTTVTPPVSLANRRVGFVLESFNGFGLRRLDSQLLALTSNWFPSDWMF